MTLRDGRKYHEKDVSWNDISNLTEVNYFGVRKYAKICPHVKHLEISHLGAKISIDADEDEQIYQSVKAMTTFSPSGSSNTIIIGRVLGKVREGKVVEEKIINSQTGEIQGFKL